MPTATIKITTQASNNGQVIKKFVTKARIVEIGIRFSTGCIGQVGGAISLKGTKYLPVALFQRSDAFAYGDDYEVSAIVDIPMETNDQVAIDWINADSSAHDIHIWIKTDPLFTIKTGSPSKYSPSQVHELPEPVEIDAEEGAQQMSMKSTYNLPKHVEEKYRKLSGNPRARRPPSDEED